jgi:hypothetical protein
MWEVFEPKSGEPVYITRFKWVAMFIAWMEGMDYAKEGEGWRKSDPDPEVSK